MLRFEMLNQMGASWKLKKAAVVRKSKVDLLYLLEMKYCK